MQTKKELYDFIATFNKKPGTYTTDELYEIGVAHKSLPQNQKSWKDLAEAVGYPGKVDSYRHYVSRKQAEEGTLPMQDIDAIESDPSEFEKLYKEKTQIRDTYNNYRLSLRNEARLESFKETFIQAAKLQRELPQVAKATLKNQKSEAILMFSDWHIGQYSNNFYNTYTKEIAKQRIGKIVAQTIRYCKINNVKTLHILNLGDLIEGIINENARLNQEMDLTEELMCAAEYMAEALNLLQEAAPVVTYRSCTDNHSRSISDKHSAIEKENFNRIVDWYVQSRLSKSKIKFISDNLDPGLGLFELENHMKVAFMHGHEGSKNQALQNIVGATREWVDIICLGHWHNPAEHVYQDMRLFINGSLCGSGPYALKHRLFTKPSQKLIICDDNSFINIDIQAEER